MTMMPMLELKEEEIGVVVPMKMEISGIVIWLPNYATIVMMELLRREISIQENEILKWELERRAEENMMDNSGVVVA